ncbi:MAG: hypothetical protein DI574_00760 [Acidovorax sp.]|nr:hypothetical protein BV908_08425 [Diaphorobacter sp. LR2014-1]PZU42813.1 MAG: hypothetical protein DI574_00760 [Acidovorax sp.]TFI43843.1 hypothetical protein E4O93_21280 [Diaphorobacter sp. DS2]
MPSSGSARTSSSNSEQPPVSLRSFPLLSNCCAIREGGRRQRGGAALARRPLAWGAPVSTVACCARH